MSGNFFYKKREICLVVRQKYNINHFVKVGKARTKGGDTKIAYYKLDLFDFLGDVAVIAFDVVVGEVFDFLCSLTRPGVRPPPGLALKFVLPMFNLREGVGLLPLLNLKEFRFKLYVSKNLT